MLYFYTNEHRAILTGCSTAAVRSSTQTGTRTGNSHIFRMDTVMNTNSIVWAGEKTWLTPKTTNIIQPNRTRSRAIPAEKWCWMKLVSSLLDWHACCLTERPGGKASVDWGWFLSLVSCQVHFSKCRLWWRVRQLCMDQATDPHLCSLSVSFASYLSPSLNW